MASQENSSSVFYTRNFDEVQTNEIARVNAYRDFNDRKLLPDVLPESGPVDVTGLALSGGGIRSAAFCLGVLQAIDSDIGIEKIDYLSTVSGGGYIGLSLSTGMNAIGGVKGTHRFPFTTGKNDRSDNVAVGHLRNYSKYLIPDGFNDVISGITVALRGVSTNIAMVLAAILMVSAFTLYANPDLLLAKPDTVSSTTWFEYFPWTKICIAAGIAIQVVWAIWRSIKGGGAEFVGNFYNFSRLWLVLAALIAFCELQPFALKSLDGGSASGWLGKLTSFISYIPQFLAPFAAIVAFGSKYLNDTIKSKESQKGLGAISAWLISKAVLALAALALPITIWVVYLELTLQGYAKYENWPNWLRTSIEATTSPQMVAHFKIVDPPYSSICVYGLAGFLLFAVCYVFLTPNANSLHRLYRDRLSKAFLFDPKSVAKRNLNDNDPVDPPSLDSQKLSELYNCFTPVHLSNAALNIQGSKFANRRGRDADFFFFSQDYSGSSATGFISTAALETAVPDLDIATIMAISGAAASSNMGSSSLKGFAPTLALLNIRLGYWMKNPKLLTVANNRVTPAGRAKVMVSLTPYLLLEMTSSLKTDSDQIYLTDGGHIENLGLYELLRRRCKRIIVVDAEADPNLTFSSLIKVERHARIDLGIRIELPWKAIHDASVAIDGVFADNEKPTNDPAAKHPHVAIGTIDYGSGEKGILVYIKSSLTGDENDYVLDYKKRYSAFPHETTSDQFFSEEQFEVYRSLGFHAAHGAFNGKSYVEGREHLPKRRSPARRSATRITLKSLFT